MNTTDAMCVPTYYRRTRLNSLLRAVAAGPRAADCVAGAVFGGIVLALLLAHTAPHQATSSPAAAVMTSATDGQLSTNRVAYNARSSTGEK